MALEKSGKVGEFFSPTLWPPCQKVTFPVMGTSLTWSKNWKSIPVKQKPKVVVADTDCLFCNE